MQTFVPFIDDQSAPYGSPNKLPIPGNATPTASTTTPGVNFPDVSSGGLMALANATTNFALRFVGERSSDKSLSYCLRGSSRRLTASLDVIVAHVGCYRTRLQHEQASAKRLPGARNNWLYACQHLVLLVRFHSPSACLG